MLDSQHSAARTGCGRLPKPDSDHAIAQTAANVAMLLQDRPLGNACPGIADSAGPIPTGRFPSSPEPAAWRRNARRVKVTSAS